MTIMAHALTLWGPWEPASPAEAMKTKLDALVSDPRMPMGASQRLAGQRAGKDHQPGLRNGVTRVPQFVPSL